MSTVYSLRKHYTIKFCNCCLRDRTCFVGQAHRACNMELNEYDNIKSTVITFVIVLNITLNGLAIAVIVRYPQLREDRTTLFMFSLLMSDLACGCTAMPISAAVCSRVTQNVRHETNFLPKIHAVFSVWFTVTSMHSLSWVTLCKMVAITNPLRYEQILTRNRCYFIIYGIWLTGALMAAIVGYHAESWYLDSCTYNITVSKGDVGQMIVVFIIAMVFPVVILVYATTRIFRAIRRTHRQIAAQVSSIGGENSHVVTINPSLTLKSVRSGRNLLIVCLALVLLTIPCIIYIIVFLLRLRDAMPTWYMFVAVWMFESNRFINSLIYIIVFQSVRDKTLDMLRSVCQLCAIY